MTDLNEGDLDVMLRRGYRRGLHLVPPHMHNAVVEYFEHGRIGDDFLLAVMSNDLLGAVTAADDINRQVLPAWVSFLYNFAPDNTWRSREVVHRWQESGGFIGRSRARAASKGGGP